MARIARVVAQGIPHHITQRGNGRQMVFADAQDHEVYLRLVREHAREYQLRVWAWCLMSNHVHLLAVPETNQSLAWTFARTHCDYARYKNARTTKCGHLWQARFYSCPVDEGALWTVMAYIERNPVRAGLVGRAEDYPWSSAQAHCRESGQDEFLDLSAWRRSYSPSQWSQALRGSADEEALCRRLREATRTGRPFGSTGFVDEMERSANRILRPRQAGRPKKQRAASVGMPGFATEIGV